MENITYLVKESNLYQNYSEDDINTISFSEEENSLNIAIIMRKPYDFKIIDSLRSFVDADTRLTNVENFYNSLIGFINKFLNVGVESQSEINFNKKIIKLLSSDLFSYSAFDRTYSSDLDLYGDLSSLYQCEKITDIIKDNYLRHMEWFLICLYKRIRYCSALFRHKNYSDCAFRSKVHDKLRILEKVISLLFKNFNLHTESEANSYLLEYGLKISFDLTYIRDY